MRLRGLAVRARDEEEGPDRRYRQHAPMNDAGPGVDRGNPRHVPRTDLASSGSSKGRQRVSRISADDRGRGPVTACHSPSFAGARHEQGNCRRGWRPGMSHRPGLNRGRPRERGAAIGAFRYLIQPPRNRDSQGAQKPQTRSHRVVCDWMGEFQPTRRATQKEHRCWIIYSAL